MWSNVSRPEQIPPRERFALPSMDQFVYAGEETPLLLRKRVVASLVVAFLALAGAYLAATALFDLPTEFDADPFREWVEARGAWGPVVFILVMALSVLFAPVPNVPIFMAAGLAWGTILGTAYSLVGLMLGSVAAFYVSRILGRRHLPRLIGRKAAARLDDLVDTFGGRVVFWARMLPVVNFDWISFLAGMTSIRFWPFFLYSLAGMLFPTFIGVAAGDGLGRDIRITIALGGFWVFGIAVSAAFFWRRQRNQKRKNSQAPAPSGIDQ